MVWCSCRWDIFTPVENLVFHHYERHKGKSVYSDHEQVRRRKTHGVLSRSAVV